MSPPLHMLRMTPDRPQLASWAALQGLLGRDGELGYALHAALQAAFGDLAPKPFRLIEGRSRGGEAAGGQPLLYAYCPRPGADLLHHARTFADPEVWQMLDLDCLRAKPMPAGFDLDARLGFEVRVRPVRRRRGRPDDRNERDAFLIACDRVDPSVPVDRAAIYRDWLAERLAESGAQLAACRLDAFQRSRVARRNAERKLCWFEGPDATLSGTLIVTDPDRFAALLARGVGRHRAFGFGMLLLRPARPG